MLLVSRFELQGHAQHRPRSVRDRFRKSEHGEMRLAQLRMDCPAGIVICVYGTSHAVPLLAEVGEGPCQLQTALPTHVGDSIQVSFDPRQKEIAAWSVPSGPIIWQRFVRQNFKTQLLNSSG